jgi:multiple sugar transport system substrate-binding protein
MKISLILKNSRYFSVLIIIVFIIFIITAAGCSTRSSEPVPSETQEIKSVKANSPDKIKIIFSYNKNDTGNDMENSILKFNMENTDSIEVEILKIPGGKYDETLNMLFTTGQSPDVFEVGSEWINSYITKNWLLNLKNYCNTEFLNRFPDWADQYMLGLYSNEVLFALPSSEMTIRLIYNKDLFKQAGLNPDNPPKTMDELKDYAERITKNEKGNKKYGFALCAGDGRKCFEQTMESTNTTSGVYYFNYQEGQYDLTKYDKWLQLIKVMKEDESLFPGETILKSDNALIQFAEGNIGMMFVNSTAPHILKSLKEQTGTICDWGVAMPPVMDNNSHVNGKVAIIPSAFYSVSSKSLYKDRAAEFWKFLYSKEHLGEMLKQGVMIPVMEDITAGIHQTPEIQKFNEFLPSENDSVFPVPPRVINDWTRIDSYIEAIEGSKIVDEVLRAESDNLNFQFNSIIDGGQLNPNIYKNPNFNWLDPLKR